MDIVWQRGQATVRDVLRELNDSSERERAYTTIMTIMRRLHRKRMLDRERHGKTDTYRPVVTRDEYVEARARAQIGDLVAEYGDVALQHFAAEMAKLDPARREALRRLARRRA